MNKEWKTPGWQPRVQTTNVFVDGAKEPEINDDGQVVFDEVKTGYERPTPYGRQDNWERV